MLKFLQKAAPGVRKGSRLLQLLQRAAFVLFFCAVPLGAFAQNIGIQSFSGSAYTKVDIDATWQAAMEGASLGLGSQLSTGFNSGMLVSVAGTQISLGPGTRLIFQESRSKDGSTVLTFELLSGSIQVQHSDADPALILRIMQEGTLLTSSTGAYSFSQGTLTVQSGIVAVETAGGQQLSLGAGQSGRLAGEPGPVSVLAQLSDENTVSPGAGPGSGGNVSTSPPTLTGRVRLTIPIPE